LDDTAVSQRADETLKPDGGMCSAHLPLVGRPRHSFRCIILPDPQQIEQDQSMPLLR
jgi:hypothetical protein